MRSRIEKFITCKFGTGVDKYCNSVWYIATIGVVCAACHMLQIPITGAGLLTVLMTLALLFCKNSFTLMPFVMMCSFVMSEETNPQSGYYNSAWKLSLLCIFLVILVAAFIFNLIYYEKWRLIFKRVYLTVSLCILTVFLLTSGWFSSLYRFNGFAIAAAVAATMFVPYSMMVNCGEFDGKKTIKYFAWIVIIAALVIGADMFQKFIINDFSSEGVKTYLRLGFVGPNTGAALMLLAIPMTFYFVYEYKHGYLFLLLIALELCMIFATRSRASIIVAIPGTLIVAIGLCFKKKKGRLGYYITFGLGVAAVVILAIVFRHKVAEICKSFLHNDLTGSGRTTLWILGFELWKDTPIFGAGFWALPATDSVYWYYSFHCTPLTYLYCGGIVAFLAYIYHRYKSIRLVFSAKLTPERVFVALTTLAMLCNALLDIALTSPAYVIYYSVMLALIECDVKKVKTDKLLTENVK